MWPCYKNTSRDVPAWIQGQASLTLHWGGPFDSEWRGKVTSFKITAILFVFSSLCYMFFLQLKRNIFFWPRVCLRDSSFEQLFTKYLRVKCRIGSARGETESE